MPFVLAFLGVVFIVAGMRGKFGTLAGLLRSDFTGQNNFGVWLFAIMCIGGLGYIPALKRLSDAFLLLVILVILLVNDKNGNGFFAGLQKAVTTPQTTGSASTSLVQSNTSTTAGIGGISVSPNASLTSGGIFSQ